MMRRVRRSGEGVGAGFDVKKGVHKYGLAVAWYWNYLNRILIVDAM